MFSVIFPGQGSQLVGMGKEFFDKFDLVKGLFKEADNILEAPLTKIILEKTPYLDNIRLFNKSVKKLVELAEIK